MMDVLERIAGELHARVRSALAWRTRDDEALDRLVRDLFDYQRMASEAYAGWCEILDVLPETVTGCGDVPALPQDAWRELRISTVAPDRIVQRFRSSGTTSSTRSIQELPDTSLYDTSLSRTFGEGLFPDGPRPVHALLPSLAETPESSLVYMVDHAARELTGAPPTTYLHDDRLDVDRIVDALRALTEPALVIGTAFSFVHLFDALDAWGDAAHPPLPLPPGSMVMETGGFKGRSRVVERELLHATLRRVFDLPHPRLVNQYGMCETSTQFYDMPHEVAGMAKAVPPWAHVSAVDPRTCVALPPGEPGLLRIVDPANLYTCQAVLTSDLGEMVDDTHFLVHGRAASGASRGCSLMVADLEGAQ